MKQTQNQKTKRLCTYNNNCYETADDGTYIEYDWNVADNLEAEFEVTYFIDGDEIQQDACEGCLRDIEDNCEEEENYEFGFAKRIREHTKSLSHKRTSRGHYTITKPWTLDQKKRWFRKWHKDNPHLCEGENGKCVEECWN